jgi:hypothetical protein
MKTREDTASATVEGHSTAFLFSEYLVRSRSGEMEEKGRVTKTDLWGRKKSYYQKQNIRPISKEEREEARKYFLSLGGNSKMIHRIEVPGKRVFYEGRDADKARLIFNTAKSALRISKQYYNLSAHWYLDDMLYKSYSLLSKEIVHEVM